MAIVAIAVAAIAGIAVAAVFFAQGLRGLRADGDPADVVVHLLQRSADGDDVIFRTDLTGENAVPVYSHPHIEDFRTTRSHLVVSVLTDADVSALVVTDLDGQHPRQLSLPGEGFVSQLQSADDGDLVGYTFSDADIGAAGGQESLLFTASAADSAADAAASPVAIEGADERVAEWHFVPGGQGILVLSFDESLLLTGEAGGGEKVFGEAIAIDGIARGSSDAVIARPEQMSVLDLEDGSEAQLVEADEELGVLSNATPLPDGTTVRTSALLDDAGLPVHGTTISHVAADGATTILFEAPATDAVLQTCVSPGARYLAVLVAPDAVSNPYDTYQLPLPERLETRIIELEEGADVVTLAGSSISWCLVPPS